MRQRAEPEEERPGLGLGLSLGLGLGLSPGAGPGAGNGTGLDKPGAGPGAARVPLVRPPQMEPNNEVDAREHGAGTRRGFSHALQAPRERAYLL